ncbi:MAG: hypothetical protein OEQ53_18635, partial [Saprospiraceae bacterium]|nr:hypothetical protein [Saprospiraceae bacterium]
GVKKCEIGHDLSKILSVELVKDFKPSPRVYKLIKDLIEPDLEKVLFVSANPWDVSGASTYGLDSIWINPEGKIRDELPFGSMMELSDLDELFMALRDN